MPLFTLFPIDTVRGGGGVGPNNAGYNTNAATADVALTAADIQGPATQAFCSMVILNMTGVLAAGHNAALPTVASLIAAFGLSGLGKFCYVLRIINTSSGAFSWTLTNGGDANWTLNGTMTVAQNAFRDFLVTLDATAATATVQAIGTGTTS